MVDSPNVATTATPTNSPENIVSIILNIGRAVPATGAVLPGSAVYAALEARGLNLLSSTHVQSDSEPTIVAEIESWADGIGIDAAQARAIAQLSIDLGQDCIASYDLSEGRGLLLGPRADAWGDFDPAFFILPDGSRLSTEDQPA